MLTDCGFWALAKGGQSRSGRVCFRRIHDNTGMFQPDSSKLHNQDDKANAPPAFDPNQTLSYNTKMKRAPQWVGSLLASNHREKNRMREELGTIKGVIPLLMKHRNGSKWSNEERMQLKHTLRAAAAVYPYLIIWALPGSILLLPFLAWHLDMRRKNSERKAAGLPKA